MASGIKFLGYTNHMGGDATVRFAIRGQEYEYHMSKRDAETVDWLSKKGTGKALALAKKRAYSFKKASITAGGNGWAIRFWTPLSDLHKGWSKRKEKYEQRGRRSIGWNPSNWDEPTEGQWNYWQNGAWGAESKSALVFDSPGVAQGAAKRHKKRGMQRALMEVVGLRGGRPDGLRQKVAAKKPKPATRFMRPENWDVAHKHGDYNVWAGGNDWESGNSWMWVEQRDKRLWCQIDHRKHPEDEGSGADNPEWHEHGLKAVDTWLEVAKDIARADHDESMAERDEGQKTWKWNGNIRLQFFEDALKDKKMKGFVFGQGYENHVWQQAKTAMALTTLARNILADDARKKFDLKKEYSKWNRKLFNGELPNLPMKWTRSRTMGGYVKQMYNRSTGEVTNKVLAMSDYLTLDQERFDSIMIHEMIHVWQGENNIFERQRQGHGPRFLAKARELSAKVGFKITVTEDISDLDASESVATKDFMVLFLEKDGKTGWMLFTDRIWQRKSQAFKGEMILMAQRGYKFTVVKSNDRQLLKLPTKNSISGKGGRLSWYRAKPGFVQDIMSGGKVIYERSKESAPKFDDSKPRRMLNGLGKYLKKNLEGPKSKVSYDAKVTTGHDRMTGYNHVTLTMDTRRSDYKIMVHTTFENDELMRVQVLFDTGTSQKFIWGSIDKYPTPKTIIDALNKRMGPFWMGKLSGVA